MSPVYLATWHHPNHSLFTLLPYPLSTRRLAAAQQSSLVPQALRILEYPPHSTIKSTFICMTYYSFIINIHFYILSVQKDWKTINTWTLSFELNLIFCFQLILHTLYGICFENFLSEDTLILCSLKDLFSCVFKEHSIVFGKVIVEREEGRKAWRKVVDFP